MVREGVLLEMNIRSMLLGIIVFVNPSNWQDSFILQSQGPDHIIYQDQNGSCYIDQILVQQSDCAEYAISLADLNEKDVKFAIITNFDKVDLWQSNHLDRRQIVVYYEEYESCEMLEKPCSIANIFLFDKEQEWIIFRSKAKSIANPYRDVLEIERVKIRKNKQHIDKFQNVSNAIEQFRPTPSKISIRMLGTNNSKLLTQFYLSNDSTK